MLTTDLHSKMIEAIARAAIENANPLELAAALGAAGYSVSYDGTPVAGPAPQSALGFGPCPAPDDAEIDRRGLSCRDVVHGLPDKEAGKALLLAALDILGHDGAAHLAAGLADAFGFVWASWPIDPYKAPPSRAAALGVAITLAAGWSRGAMVPPGEEVEIWAEVLRDRGALAATPKISADAVADAVRNGELAMPDLLSKFKEDEIAVELSDQTLIAGAVAAVNEGRVSLTSVLDDLGVEALGDCSVEAFLDELDARAANGSLPTDKLIDYVDADDALAVVRRAHHDGELSSDTIRAELDLECEHEDAICELRKSHDLIADALRGFDSAIGELES